MVKANDEIQAQAQRTQQKKRTNPGTGTTDAAEEVDEPRQRHSGHSKKSGQTQAQA